MPWLAITLDVSPANAETLVDALLETGAASVELGAGPRASIALMKAAGGA